MRIDVHVHTKKIKSGDAETRNINKDRFSEILKSTDVRILAITNHNHFDLKQYKEFRDSVVDSCQIWPGIELDILENDKRAHLIVITNPKNHIQFNEKVSKILAGRHPDSFTISIQETVDAFDELDCVFIAHYYAKKPNLGDEEVEQLINTVSNPKRVLKEATNSISAGIYVSHGHSSIYGSDVHDWDEYITIAKQLPELRLPVESFEQFCLLLEKDEATIDTLLDKKEKENIEISPFSAAELIRLDIYNDINILFGSKGTGKTEILETLSKYYNSKGYKTHVYKSNDQHLNDVFDIKGHDLDITATNLGIDECENEILLLKEATEEEVTSLAKYRLHFSSEEKNRIARKLRIKNITKADENQPKRKLEEVKEMMSMFTDFRVYTSENTNLREYIGDLLTDELLDVIDRILSKITADTEEKFVDYKSSILLNGIIEKFITEIAKKTGQPQKPTKTGFSEYASNRLKIEAATKKVLSAIDTQINAKSEYIGSLGVKGDLFCKTNIIFQNGRVVNGEYSSVNSVKKKTQKEFAKRVESISKHIYSNDLFEKISEMNEIDDIETITSISDLLLFSKHFTLNGNIYSPSNGESSMILLHRELKEDKDIYLIDEPEKSLGNDYISDVVVPLLKEKALLGKKVIVATHDANIAVRTLPYNSIYRLHDMNRYYTLIGNPFSNTLKCIYRSMQDLDWKEISMKTLEGGKDAFGERGKIYGN